MYSETLGHCKKVYAFFYQAKSASIFFNEVHTVERQNIGLRLYSWRGKKSIRFAGTCSKADAKEWMLLQIKTFLLFSCQPMFLLFVYFLTVPAFILLFQAVIFHICIYFSVEMVLGLQRLFAGCYSASLFSAHCSNTHLPCRFIPSPHTAKHSLSFLNQR